MGEAKGYLNDFKGFDWKKATDDDIIAFGKTLDFPERGISTEECKAHLKALNTLKGSKPLILETGMFYGTSTRISIAWTLKYGGIVYSCDLKIMPLFEEKMEEAGYWKYVNPLIGPAQKAVWNQGIDFLFIDADHSLQDALGEYMKFRIWLTDNAVIGFHDSDNCTGVKLTMDIAQVVDRMEFLSESNQASGIKFFKMIKKNEGGAVIRRWDLLNEELRAKDRIIKEQRGKE